MFKVANFFSSFYKKVIIWSKHKHAPYYLAGLSFAESSVSPIPPDPLLLTMALAEPSRAWRYAAVTTLASVLGGMVGYGLGSYLLQQLMPWVDYYGYSDVYQQVQAWFSVWGIWVVFAAAFTPIPYKIFTIGAGAARMAFLPFIIASMIGRGLRFFLLSALLRWQGKQINTFLYRYVDYLGWAVLLIFCLGYILRLIVT